MKRQQHGQNPREGKKLTLLRNEKNVAERQRSRNVPKRGLVSRQGPDPDSGLLLHEL